MVSGAPPPRGVRPLARGDSRGELGSIPSACIALPKSPRVQPSTTTQAPPASAIPASASTASGAPADGVRDGESPCASCGSAFQGRFCPRCGERRLGAADLSLRAFAREALSTFTNLDSTVKRSFAALVARPGLLTREYLAGRRTRYLRPLQLFLFCNVIFFFVQPLTGFNTLTTPLHVHLHHLPYSPLARQIIDRVVEAKGVSAREYELLFNATLDAQARTLVVAMVPLLALLIAAMHRRRYFVEHLVFSVHFFAFFLLLLPALTTALWGTYAGLNALGVRAAWLWTDAGVTTVLLSLCGAYLFAGLRRVYGQGRAASGWRAAVLALGVMGVIQVYRLILFFTTVLAL